MRRASRASSKEKRLLENGDATALSAMATRATYVGSIEHKTYKSPAGDPRPRNHHAGKCPRLPSEQWPAITETLRAAIRRGCVSVGIDPGEVPRYVWARFQGVLYEARHLVTPFGGYKAFPIETFELPDGALELIDAEETL